MLILISLTSNGYFPAFGEYQNLRLRMKILFRPCCSDDICPDQMRGRFLSGNTSKIRLGIFVSDRDKRTCVQGFVNHPVDLQKIVSFVHNQLFSKSSSTNQPGFLTGFSEMIPGPWGVPPHASPGWPHPVSQKPEVPLPPTTSLKARPPFFPCRAHEGGSPLLIAPPRLAFRVELSSEAIIFWADAQGVGRALLARGYLLHKNGRYLSTRPIF